jgi:hypothetical protein
VHYAYHPCDDTILSLHELQGRNLRHPASMRVMSDEIVDGMDELGVLLYGHAKNAYWYGSQLTIHEARSLAPYQNATGLQVSSAVVAGHDLGDRESRRAASSTPTSSTTIASSRSRSRTSASWSAPTPTGRRSTTAAACSRRTSIATIRGSSAT